MIKNLVQTLMTALPRFAEEEGDHYCVKRSDLVDALCREQNVDTALAVNTVSLCEALLDTLAALRAEDLQRDEWRFVSFPAQLMALSVLTALGDSESRFFEADFWNTHGINDDKKDRQREVLRVVENRRNDRHLTHSATPIRFIHVAWSVIKHDGKILFYQREDTRKRFESNAGDYGLIGGRVNQKDLPPSQGDIKRQLQIVQSADIERVEPALTETLKRELLEETGLVYEQHYGFKPWRRLKPYRQVQGTAPNHALTEYFITLYTIELNLEGFCHLQQKLAADERLVWFSLDELAEGKTKDGKTAYLKALYEDFDNDKSRLKQALHELDDSFSANYIMCREKYRILLPQDAGHNILAGFAGKESPTQITPNQRQLSLLSGLAVHLRGFAFIEPDPSITLHPYGWIEVQASCALQAELVELANCLKDSNEITVENQKDRWFRLSVLPDSVFFDDAYFDCSVDSGDLSGNQSKIPLAIVRREIDTPFGIVGEERKEVTLSLQLAHDLLKLQRQCFSADNDEAVKIRENYKKSLHRHCLDIGMMGLLRQEAGLFKICCEFVAGADIRFGR